MKLSAILIPVLFSAGITHAQMMGSGMGHQMGSGMMGQGWSDKELAIPGKLPTPADQKWVGELEAILSSEQLSRGQYQFDEARYGVSMPYAMIIPQEDNHIRWLTKLLAAYGLSGDVQRVANAKIVKTDSLKQAYKLAMKLESNLISDYERLLKQAPDDTARSVLSTIQLQSRFHYVMFDHALKMGGRMGGMMGRNP
jgi:hypothetical protein